MKENSEACDDCGETNCNRCDICEACGVPSDHCCSKKEQVLKILESKDSLSRSCFRCSAEIKRVIEIVKGMD